MKKFTSLLALLMIALCGTTAYADLHEDLQGDKTFEVGDPINGDEETPLVPGQWYMISQNRNSTGYVGTNEAGDALIKTQASLIEGQYAKNVAACFWQFIEVEEEPWAVETVPEGFEAKTYKLVNGLGQYWGTCTANQVPAEASEDDAEVWTVWSFDSDQKWGFVTSAGYRLDNNNYVDNVATVVVWGQGQNPDANNSFKIHPVEFTETTPEEVAAGELSKKVETYAERYEYFFGEFAVSHTIDATAFGDAYDKASSYDPSSPEYEGMTAADIEKLGTDLDQAWEALMASTVRNVVPGYYYVRSALPFEYIEEQTIEGEEDPDTGIAEEITIPGRYPKNGLYVSGTNLKWGEIDETKAEYIWKVEAGEDGQFILKSATGTQVANVATSAPVTMAKEANPVTITYAGFTTLENYDDVEADAPVFDIRPANQEGNSEYLHAGGHGYNASERLAKGKGGNVVGWSPGYNASTLIPGATEWIFVKVDDEVAEELINGPIIKVTTMIEAANDIAAKYPAQKTIAQDIASNVDTEHPLITEPTQFYSPYTTDDKQCDGDPDAVYPFLLDGNINTYWHSAWEGGKLDNGVHYLQVSDVEVSEGQLVALVMTRRPVSNDHITQMSVWGYDENDEAIEKEDGELLAEFSMPFKSNNEEITTVPFDTKGHAVLRFYVESTYGSQESNRGYWHCSEFQLYPATVGQVATTSQAQVRTAEIAAMDAAVEKWNEGEYSLETVSDPAQEPFATDYKALMTASEAWSAVYVDPAALRAAMATVPTSTMFVQGNNPGQWKELPAIATAKANAEAYDNSGAYTPEKSAAMIESLTKGLEDAYEAANPVETGKWYRIKFPTEAQYEAYGWNKTGAQANINENIGTDVELSPALFGKTVAVASYDTEAQSYTDEDGDEVTLTQYLIRNRNFEKEAMVNATLHFMNAADIEADMDLFRFVALGDTAYAIQNKATGLYLNQSAATGSVRLSVQPTAWTTKAIGAGASAIKGVSVFSNANRNYLHAQRDINMLVTWTTNTVNTNSNLLIEEVEAVSSETFPTEITFSVWAGGIHTMCYPVELTPNAEDGSIYTVKNVSIDDEDEYVTVELNEYEAGYTLQAGEPFIYISADDYKPFDNRKYLDEDQTDENPDYFIDGWKNIRMTYKPGLIKNAGEKNMLKGCFELAPIGGKGNIYAKANGAGFAGNTGANDNFTANTAVIMMEEALTTKQMSNYTFDYEEKAPTTKVNDALAKISKKGEIYTLDGKFCGTSLRGLGRGIYIVNGVKVILK